MGQESLCEVRIRRGTALQEGQARALLESRELILRGELRRRMPLAALTEVQALGGELHLSHATEAGTEQLVLLLGEPQATTWARKILAPPPSLAHKLGLGESTKAFVIGRVDDAELAAALRGHTARSAARAAVVVAVMRSEAELQAAMAAHAAMPCPGFWAVYPKGKASTLADATVRSVLRAAGYADNKTTAVSEVLTATRYRRSDSPLPGR